MKNINDYTECILISGGEFSSLDDITDSQFVIACDKGMSYAQKCNIIPHIFVGDFDSFSGTISDETEVLKLPKHKDDTDTLYALKYAISLGFRKLSLRCALGGRLDHLFANLQCCDYVVRQGCEIKIESDSTDIFFLRNGEMVLPKRESGVLSVFALSEKCEGVTVNGAEYSINNISLSNTFPIGVSNEWLTDIIVKCESGTLMIMVTDNK